MPDEQLISEIETLIRRDPARRGLIGVDGNGPGTGELLAASRLFAEKMSGVCLMTGFFIPACQNDDGSVNPASGLHHETSGHAETDGPPGTAVLADVLARLGVPVTVITDQLCEPVIRTACSIESNQKMEILSSPTDPEAASKWRANLLQSDFPQSLSHLVAIERVGPGHTMTSLQNCAAAADILNRLTEQERHRRLPGYCSNMRGENIDSYSADLHLLAESIQSQMPTVKFVGIGDGGNEIGMGRFKWSDLRTRIPGPNADRIPCRIPADRTIVAGVSNWGAYALAAAVAIQHNRIDLLEHHTAHAQQRLLEKIVYDSGAVDGVTRKNEPTVDGLPFLTQIQPWIAIRQRLGLDP